MRVQGERRRRICFCQAVPVIPPTGRDREYRSFTHWQPMAATRSTRPPKAPSRLHARPQARARFASTASTRFGSQPAEPGSDQQFTGDVDAWQSPIRKTTVTRSPTARQIGELVVFFLSDAASAITGQSIAVDGGSSAMLYER